MRKCIPGVWLMLAAGCAPCPPCDPAREGDPPRVVLQITETEDAQALERMVAELRARNVRAVVLVNGPFAAANCEQLRGYRDSGFEIMAFVRPGTGTLSQLSRAEQEQLIGETQSTLAACLGTPVEGFRATRFDQNEDTWEILATLGFRYDLAFAAGRSFLPGHQADTLPYFSAEYSFWAVPMHIADNDGHASAFCDNPFAGLSADGWEALLKSEFDRLHVRGHPLLVEFHPVFSGVDEGRFLAYTHFLDYAVQQGAEFLSVADYVGWVAAACGVCPE